jgi:hypothetical protein
VLSEQICFLSSICHGRTHLLSPLLEPPTLVPFPSVRHRDAPHPNSPPRPRLLWLLHHHRRCTCATSLTAHALSCRAHTRTPAIAHPCCARTRGHACLHHRRSLLHRPCRISLGFGDHVHSSSVTRTTPLVISWPTHAQSMVSTPSAPRCSGKCSFQPCALF